MDRITSLERRIERLETQMWLWERNRRLAIAYEAERNMAQAMRREPDLELVKRRVELEMERIKPAHLK